MNASDRRTLGMDRPLHLDWLDAVAGQLAQGSTEKEAREFAWKLLEGVVAGDKYNSARGKTLTVLGRVWITIPPANEALRSDALALLERADSRERLGIHWAMISAAYPFFVDIATHAGKLLALNGDFSVALLNRRLAGVWGDRSTVRTASQRVVRSMVQWGVLRDGEDKGQYLPIGTQVALSKAVSALLVEGLLISLNSGAPLNHLLSHPSMFPFESSLTARGLRGHERLRVVRQGDQVDFVELVRPSRRPQAGTEADDETSEQLSLKL